MLDINLFRMEKGGDPELVRNSQRSRFASVELVDEVISLDEAWRQRQHDLDKIRAELNKTSKDIGKLKKKQYATALIQKAKNTLEAKLVTIGKICTSLCPSGISNDEIFKEVVFDLLDDPGSVAKAAALARVSIQIRETANDSITLAGVTEAKVKSKEEIALHLARGSSSRATGSTNMNSQSRT